MASRLPRARLLTAERSWYSRSARARVRGIHSGTSHPFWRTALKRGRRTRAVALKIIISAIIIIIHTFVPIIVITIILIIIFTFSHKA